MKILYLTPNFESFWNATFSQMMHGLDYPVSQLTLYGPGYDLFNFLEGERDIVKVIDKIYRGCEGCDEKFYPPDVIIMWDHQGTGWAGEFYNLDQVKALKVLWSCDIHKDAGSQDALNFIRDAKIGLILMSYDRDLKTEAGRTFSSLHIPIEYYPFAVDPDFYKPLDVEKKHDVSLLGHLSSSYYPYRVAYDKALSSGALRYHSPEKEMFFREDFVKHICESWICVTCSSSYKYPLPKYFEVMACGSLLMADKPMDADYLHFVPGENFIEVNPDNLMSKVDYYLNHKAELLAIAENGRKTVLTHHTSVIRGKELVEKLSKYV